MASNDHQEKEDLDPTSIHSFVAIDMESLELLTSHKDVLEPTTTTPDPPRIHQILKKSLSRKGSHRGGGGGERKEVEVGAAAASFTAGGPDLCDESAVAVHVAGDLGTTPTSAGGAGRRLGKRSSSPWLDPRRVLVLFATMSSMGTLVLLYLTLSMVGGEANDQ